MTVTEMPRHERPLSEQYRVVAEQFGEAYRQASFMENTRSGMLARLIKKEMASSNEKLTRATAELNVKASDAWFEFNDELAKAKERVEILRAQKKFIEMRQWEQADANANVRAEKRM